MREDDAIGIEVVRKFKSEHPNKAEVLELKDDTTKLINIWLRREVIIIDAVESGSDEFFEFYEMDSITPFKDLIRNSHGIGIEQIFQLSKELNKLPESIYFIGIPSLSYQLGNSMTKKVSRRIPGVVQKISAYIEQLES